MDDLEKPMFGTLVVTMVLTAIVAVGNWKPYSRVEKVEKSLGLRATQQ